MHYRRLYFFITSILLLVCVNSAIAEPELTPNINVTEQQKIGQMLMVGFCGMQLHPNDAIVQDILAQRIGGVILYKRYDQTKGSCNIESPQQLKQLTQQLQAYALQAAQAHHNHLYPLLIAIDNEGGKVNNLPEKKGFPHNTLSAADIGKGSYQEAHQAANQLAQTLQTMGVNLDFAPVLDVNINPDNPVISQYGRSFSADPAQVTAYARIFSQAFRDHHILCTYKHFPGHGSSTTDSHLGMVDVSQTWQAKELLPYQRLLQDPIHCDLVMTAHVINRQLDKENYPASLSRIMTRDWLRKKLQFDGVIVTDDLQMGAIMQHYDLNETVRLAINAGANMLLFSNQLVKKPVPATAILQAIMQEKQAGKIPADYITASYERVMTLKKSLQ